MNRDSRVQLTVNGRPRQAADHTTLAELVSSISDRPTGIAVALNNEVVPRGGWSEISVQDGDRIDVVTAVQGG
jgi:sulfur carrier protein